MCVCAMWENRYKFVSIMVAIIRERRERIEVLGRFKHLRERREKEEEEEGKRGKNNKIEGIHLVFIITGKSHVVLCSLS